MNIDKNLNFESLLALNYKNLGISDDEYVLLTITYELVQTGTKFVNPSDLSLLCGFSTTKIDVVYSGLIAKEYISNEFDDKNVLYTSFDGITKKLLNNASGGQKKVEEPQEENIYEYMQTFFGRLLSPLEYDVIQMWITKEYSYQLIKAACDIAQKSGNKSIRYIDTIIYEENRKAEMGDEEYQRRQQETIELSKVDWLNK